jgi:hypothetical protein
MKEIIEEAIILFGFERINEIFDILYFTTPAHMYQTYNLMFMKEHAECVKFLFDVEVKI